MVGEKTIYDAEAEFYFWNPAMSSEEIENKIKRLKTVISISYKMQQVIELENLQKGPEFFQNIHKICIFGQSQAKE